MTTHRVPATPSRVRPHVLDGTCWCKPQGVTLAKRVVMQHNPEAPPEPEVPDLPHVIRTPRKRSRWMRPWGKR